MDYVIIADRSVIEVRFENLVEALRRGVEKTR